MNQDTKIECYRKAYQTLKPMEGVRNLGYPEEKKDLEFYCDIGRFHVNYNLRLNRDFITIRAGKLYKGKTDEELDQIGRELSEGQSFYYTGYDEKLYLQLSLPMAGISDEAARTRVDEETIRFFHFLMDVEGVSMEEVPETEEQEPEAQEKGESRQGVFTEPGQEDDRIPLEEPAPGVTEPESRMAELEWIAARRKDTEEKEAALKERESAFETREGEVNARAESLKNREDEVTRREADLAKLQEEAEAQANQARTQQEELARREAEIQASEQSLKEREGSLAEQEQQLKERELHAASRISEVEKREASLQEQEAAMQGQKSQLSEKEETLTEREKLVVTKSSILEEKEAMLEEKAEGLNRREQEVKNTLAQLAQEDETLSRRMKEAEAKEAEAKEQIREAGIAAELKQELETNKAVWKRKLASAEESFAQERKDLNEAKTALAEERDRLQELVEQGKAEQEETEKKLANCKQDLKETRAQLQEAARSQEELQKAKEQEALAHAHKAGEYQKSLEAKETENERLTSELRKAKEELRKTGEEQADLLQELEAQKETEKRLRSSLTRKAAEQEADRDQITTLKDQLAEYKRQMEHIGTPEEVLKDFAETRKENRMLKREIQDMEMEAAANEKVLLDRIQALLDEQETAEVDARKEEEAQLPQNLAERMAGELKTSGITVTPEEASGHWYLRGTKESCTIVIDVEQRIVQIAKELRKPFKYNEDVSNWNREDFAESYILDKSGITCRRQVRDVTMDVNKVLRKLIILK